MIRSSERTDHENGMYAWWRRVRSHKVFGAYAAKQALNVKPGKGDGSIRAKCEHCVIYTSHTTLRSDMLPVSADW